MVGKRLPTGVPGLDTILEGGLRARQSALVRGPPGSGKTIVGLSFLAAGVDEGETSLFVNLGEPQEYVEETAQAFDLHGDEILFHNLAPTREQFEEAEAYSLFEAAEVEQPGFIAELRERVDAIEPDRVLLDPVTEIRHLTTDERGFRARILGLLDYLKVNDVTVMLTSQASEAVSDDDLQFLTDTVITLAVTDEWRTVEVSKFRGSSFRRGQHFYQISEDGIDVWPRLRPTEKTRDPAPGTLSSGVPALDELLGGGLERGTVSILSGPTGVGKTTTGVQFLVEAARTGTPAVLFQFEEARRTLRQRAASIGIPLEEALETGGLSLVEIAPDEYTLGEFEQLVRDAVADGTEIVMIDGMQGFTQNLRGVADESRAIVRIGRYLRAAGVSTVLVNEVHNITGEFRVTEARTSNLADNIVFLRHVESRGEMRKVIGVLKMRTSSFERRLRELEISEDGIRVGDPLPGMRGILTGTPEWTGADEDNE